MNVPLHIRRIGTVTLPAGDSLDAKAKATQPRPTPGRMNRTEAAYAAHLELLKAAGEVLWYGFEAVKLRLAGKTYYTPDFAVLAWQTCAAPRLEFHEVKGFWRDDARIKIKVAAEHFPFQFIAVKKSGGGWDYETIPGPDLASVSGERGER